MAAKANGHTEVNGLRERILAAGTRLRIVPIETYHAGWVWIREFTGADRDRAREMTRNEENSFDKPLWRGRLAAMYLCNEQGELLFDPDADAEALNNLPAELIEEVISKGGELAKMGAEAIEEAKANFRQGRSGASSSASPVTLAA